MKAGNDLVVFCAFMAVVVVGVFFALSHSFKQADYFPPRSTLSPWTNGLKALYELLEASGFEVSRFGGNEYHYPEGGCVVIADGNSQNPVALFGLGLDTRQIKGWLEEGGVLVVLSEVEFWSQGKQIFDRLDGKVSDGFFEMMEELESGTQPDKDNFASLQVPPGVVVSNPTPGTEGNATALYREYRDGQVYELSQAGPNIWGNVESIELADQHIPQGINGCALLALDPDIPVVVYRQVGAGEIFWVTFPEMFANDWIGRQDNHRLALALLERASRGGPVVFDEHLHGYTNQRYNAGSLITKTTGGKLLMLLALAVVVMFLGQAVRPARFLPQKVMPRRQASEMVLAQASLYRRARLQDSIAQRLVDGLKRSYMQAKHLSTPPQSQELAQVLEASPQLSAEVDGVLLNYLNGKATPASPDGLFRLAKACYQVQLRLG